MARELPDYAFEGIGADLLFDRNALGQAVWSNPRSAGWDEAEMSGALDWLKKGAKAVASPIVKVTKAVGKGVVNAAASRVGLGPVFTSGTASIVPQPSAQQALAAAPAPTNYMPWILGGGAAVAVAAIILITRKKK